MGLTEVLLVREAGASTADPSGEVCAIVLIAGCLAFRRSLPMISAVLVFTGLAIVSVAGADSRAWEVAALMTATYSCARHASWTGAWTVLWAAVLYGILIMRLEGGTGFWQGLGNITFYLALMVLSPWVAGLSLRRRQEASQHDADRAVEQERVRIARELHDVVGHALGLIVVQAEGERALLPSDGSESTRAALAAIADNAREALNDVRRLLLVMRSADDRLGPQPGLADVPRLLDGMTAAGLPAELVVQGDPRPLPPAVDLSAYRVVQESLTNSLRHSQDARARVVLRYAPGTIGIEVTDDGQATPGEGSRGFGLLGMRERVAVFGGTIEAGPRPGGGFRVQVQLPSAGRSSDGPARTRV